MQKKNADVDDAKRFWIVATGSLSLAGSCALVLPLVESLHDKKKNHAAENRLELDILSIAPGEKWAGVWDNKPLLILHRTPEQLASLDAHEDMLIDPLSDKESLVDTPAFAKNKYRSIKPAFLVVLGVCTHLGCVVTDRFSPTGRVGRADYWPGGFLCPCHGSRFDLAGRAFKEQPATKNLVIPPYRFLNDHQIVIGEETVKL